MNWAIRRMTAADIDMVLALEEKTPEAPHWKRLEYERCLVSDSASVMRAAFVADAGGEHDDAECLPVQTHAVRIT